MGRILRKGESGIATTYISRKQALKKLQLSLKDFRRLCILKGIYPVEPSHKKKANKNNSTNKTYFLLKDIRFLSHEPLIDTFRNYKVFYRRLKRAIGKQDQETSRYIRQNEPTYKLDSLVKERYPTFINALRELDDVLSLCFLFSTLPKDRVVRPELTLLCRRLTVEFLHYCMEARCLRKVFISIKGFYYQVEILGQTITWMTPHNLGYARPSDVDFKIMLTFVQFYSTVLGFVNYKLYNSINLIYPPKFAVTNVPNQELLEGEEDTAELFSALNLKLKSSVENDIEEENLDEFAETDDDLKIAEMSREQLKRFKNLFSGCRIFLNREVPRESLVFIIRCFGGEVSFDKTISVGATFDEDDEKITHQIVDRPNISMQFLNRSYVQPQWVFDSVNARVLLPIDKYLPGEKLPAHLSPFVEEKEGDYVPPEKLALLEYQKGNVDALNKKELANDDDSDEQSEKEIDEEESSEDESVYSDSDEDDVNNDSTNNASRLKRKFVDDGPELNPSETTIISKKATKDIDGQKKANDLKSNLKGSVTPGKIIKEDTAKIAQKEAAEEKHLAIMMMHKKDKYLYDKIVFGQKRKKREALKLKEKRENLNKTKKLKKK